MRFRSISRSMLAAMVCMSVCFSCSNDDDDTTDPTPTFDITLKDTKFGKVLTDQKGMTLYYFAKDVKGVSTCTGGCLTTWPVFTAENLKLDTGLNSADFGSVATADGKKQITFKGWPLYHYKDDAAPGDVKGEDVGKVWFVAKPSYSLLLASAQLVGNDTKSYIVESGTYKEGTGATIYFTDVNGVTIYGFANDKNKKNNYTKSDFSNDGTWPIFYTDITDLPSTVDKTQFATIDVFGKKQLTYKGWPLYYFGSDNKERGASKGVSVPKPGIWPIVQIDTPVAPAQ